MFHEDLLAVELPGQGQRVGRQGHRVGPGQLLVAPGQEVGGFLDALVQALGRKGGKFGISGGFHVGDVPCGDTHVDLVLAGVARLLQGDEDEGGEGHFGFGTLVASLWGRKGKKPRDRGFHSSGIIQLLSPKIWA